MYSSTNTRSVTWDSRKEKHKNPFGQFLPFFFFYNFWHYWKWILIWFQFTFEHLLMKFFNYMWSLCKHNSACLVRCNKKLSFLRINCVLTPFHNAQKDLLSWTLNECACDSLKTYLRNEDVCFDWILCKYTS